MKVAFVPYPSDVQIKAGTWAPDPEILGKMYEAIHSPDGVSLLGMGTPNVFQNAGGLTKHTIDVDGDVDVDRLTEIFSASGLSVSPFKNIDTRIATDGAFIHNPAAHTGPMCGYPVERRKEDLADLTESQTPREFEESFAQIGGGSVRVMQIKVELSAEPT